MDAGARAQCCRSSGSWQGGDGSQGALLGEGRGTKTEISGKNVKTPLTSADRKKLVQLLEGLGPHAKVERLGRKLSSDELWHAVVSQVCVMGAARGMDRIGKDPKMRTRFTKATSLRAWRRSGFKASYFSQVLIEFGATRFPKRAARQLKQIATNPEAVKDTRVVWIDDLPTSRDPNTIRDELMRRCPTFKRKSVSDYMITAGVSDNVIALDVRVVGALRKYLGFNLTAGRVQGSGKVYLSVEQALREVCQEAGCKLARLDRASFRLQG